MCLDAAWSLLVWVKQLVLLAGNREDSKQRFSLLLALHNPTVLTTGEDHNDADLQNSKIRSRRDSAILLSSSCEPKSGYLRSQPFAEPPWSAKPHHGVLFLA